MGCRNSTTKEVDTHSSGQVDISNIYHAERANWKTREDQLKSENDQLHQKLSIFERKKRTEIRILEQKLRDFKQENDKALAEKEAQIQALQKEKKNNLARAIPKEDTEQIDEKLQGLTEQLQQKEIEMKKLEINANFVIKNIASGFCCSMLRVDYLESLLAPKIRLSDLKKQADITLAKMVGEKQVMQKKYDELLLRLNEMTGRPLTDNSPNIADLSDENRPTKLAEKYAELYDNEWTDAFSYLQTFDAFKESEKLVINTLVIFLVEAFTLSTKTTQGKLENLRNTLNDFYGNTSSKDGQVKDIMKQLKDQMKKVTKPSENLMKEYMDVMLKRMTSLSITSLDSGTFKPYLQKCLEICWLMAVQDPPLYLTLENCQKGQIFNRNIFKEYSKSGPFIDFVVWPAVFL